MDQKDPFWPKEVHFGPFTSAKEKMAIPDPKAASFRPKLWQSFFRELDWPPLLKLLGTA